MALPDPGCSLGFSRNYDSMELEPKNCMANWRSAYFGNLVRPEADPLFVERLRVGLWLVLLAIVLFVFADVVVWRGRIPALHVSQLIQTTAILVVLRALRFPWIRERAVLITLLMVTLHCVTGAVAGILTHNDHTTALLFVVLAMATATLLPWGVAPQLVTATVAVVALGWNVYAVSGSLALFGYPSTVAVLVAASASVWIARELDRHRTAAIKAEAALREEADISAALARVGQELIASFSTAALLDRLCRVTTEVLQCDSAYASIWEHEAGVHVPVSGYGQTPEYWESVRALRIPHDAVAGLVGRLERDTVVQTFVGDAPDSPPVAIAQQYGLTVLLFIALRREGEIFGVLIAAYRGRRYAFTGQQERLARGIAHLAALALENARLLEELQRANSVKADFVASMSHELRTPLNVIVGYNDLLLDGTLGVLSDEQNEAVARTQYNARELLDLINAILDISRLEARRVPVQRLPLDVPLFIEEIAADTEVSCAKPGVSFAWIVARQLPALHTDALKLKVVLKNLIGNAAKFTETGTVTVAVEPADGGVAFAVTDTGIGIPPQQHSMIFEAFRQGDASTYARYGGAGLGLHIVRRILDLLGGTISLQSDIGRGSCFRVHLPLETPHSR